MAVADSGIQTDIRRLRFAALLEGGTLLLLLGIAVPVKHLAGYPLATAIMGPIHGIAFLFYLWMLVQAASAGGWTRGEILRLMAAAFIPFGGIASERLLRRKQALLAQPA